MNLNNKMREEQTRFLKRKLNHEMDNWSPEKKEAIGKDLVSIKRDIRIQALKDQIESLNIQLEALETERDNLGTNPID